MSATTDIQAKANEIMAAAAAAATTEINANPQTYLKDRLGRKLTYLLADSVTRAAGAVDFSVLNQ